MHRSVLNPRLAPGAFYGEMLRQQDAGGFSLSETRYLPGSTLPRHSHESHFFCFILSGTYREVYERSIRACEPTMLLYHPAGELHAQYFDQSAVQLFRVEVNRARMRQLNHTEPAQERRDFRGGLPVRLAHKLYQEFCEPDAVSHLAIEGLGLELLAAILRPAPVSKRTSRQSPRWLRQAHELIKSHFLEQLVLGNIARTVGVHPVTLAREFRRHYECTVGDMVRRERIGFACRHLLNREASIADIAVSAGFYDQSHFARTFKKLTGITPAQYRGNYRPH